MHNVIRPNLLPPMGVDSIKLNCRQVSCKDNEESSAGVLELAYKEL